MIASASAPAPEPRRCISIKGLQAAIQREMEERGVSTIDELMEARERDARTMRVRAVDVRIPTIETFTIKRPPEGPAKVRRQRIVELLAELMELTDITIVL